jgi:predicted AlkP superfamily phosphohydrolase/phosphomutase/Flp pilus assembly protein TadD
MRGFALLPLLLVLACGSEPERSRVLVLGLDGLDPQTVDLLMSEGRLPNLAKIRQEGAYGRLISQKPLLSPIIWTTIATGKTPDQHGIGHFVALSEETGEELPATSAMRRVKALWNIASDAGLEVATVGWWATWPPEEVRGAVVSDHTAYHFLFEDGFTGGEETENKTHPPELLAEIEPFLVRPGDLAPEELATFVTVSEEELARPFDFQDDLAHFKWAYATAKSYRDVGLHLWRTRQPDLALIYVEGTDSTSHLFGHLFRAEGLAGELAEQQRRFGRAVEEMYAFADRLVGEVMAAMDERTTLLVVSDHGFELGVLHDDPSKTRDLRRVSERFHRLEGVIYVYGHRVRRARLDRPSIVDVAPTVLALLGLPVARDMPGRVLGEAFGRDAPAKERIATYEDGGGPAGPDAAADAGISRAQLEHLRSLGYLGGSGAGAETASPQGDRNLAAIHFEKGDFEEAARRYAALIEASPEDAALRTSLAGALGALGRYAEAMAELDRAIAVDSLNVEAYHNRAVIWERRGEPAKAVADYETALRYQPQYAPSRQALVRLTGSSDVRRPRTAEENAAAELAEGASLEARRGNYAEALRLLDEAEDLAPAYVLIYQYRSNVAYLMGDLEGAIAALEKGLELEGDNALFKKNLERLRSENRERRP